MMHYLYLVIQILLFITFSLASFSLDQSETSVRLPLNSLAVSVDGSKAKLPDNLFARMTVIIHRGENLLSMDRNGFSDPYCIIESTSNKNSEKQEHRTTTIYRTLNPEWKESDEREFTFNIFDIEDKVAINLWDYDVFPKKDDPMGSVQVPIRLEPYTAWFDIQKPEGCAADRAGRIRISASLNFDRTKSARDDLSTKFKIARRIFSRPAPKRISNDIISIRDMRRDASFLSKMIVEPVFTEIENNWNVSWNNWTNRAHSSTSLLYFVSVVWPNIFTVSFVKAYAVFFAVKAATRGLENGSLFRRRFFENGFLKHNVLGPLANHAPAVMYYLYIGMACKQWWPAALMGASRFDYEQFFTGASDRAGGSIDQLNPIRRRSCPGPLRQMSELPEGERPRSTFRSWLRDAAITRSETAARYLPQFQGFLHASAYGTRRFFELTRFRKPEDFAKACFLVLVLITFVAVESSGALLGSVLSFAVLIFIVNNVFFPEFQVYAIMHNAKCLYQFRSKISDNHTDIITRNSERDTQHRNLLMRRRTRRSTVSSQLTILGEDANNPREHAYASRDLLPVPAGLVPISRKDGSVSPEQIGRGSRKSPVSVDKFGISSAPGGSITATSADDSTINTRVRTISGSSGSDEQSYTMIDDDGVKVISDGNDLIHDWAVNRSAAAPTREGHGEESSETGEKAAETAEQSAVTPTRCLPSFRLRMPSFRSRTTRRRRVVPLPSSTGRH